MTRSLRLSLRGAFVAAVFAAGYLVGTLDAPTAEAQLGELGKSMMDQAAGSEGVVGQAARLGTAITEMQQHVDGLQKNIDTLSQVKAALGG